MSVAKTVLVTGSNRGIGLEFVRHYVKQGWQVIATARDTSSVKELHDVKPWKVLPLDASKEDSVLQLSTSLQDVSIDLMINNAGNLYNRGLMDTTVEDLKSQFEVNAIGPFLMTRAFKPQLKSAAKNNGNAVVAQISSLWASIEMNRQSTHYGYRASKAALNQLNKCLSRDLRADRIITLALHPGHVRTDMNKIGTATPGESVNGMQQVISRATMGESGKFYDYQGKIVPW